MLKLLLAYISVQLIVFIINQRTSYNNKMVAKGTNSYACEFHD